MKAVRVTRPGDSSVLEVVDLPMPEPRRGEVVVRIEAAGVNFLDIQTRLDRYRGARPSRTSPGAKAPAGSAPSAPASMASRSATGWR